MSAITLQFDTAADFEAAISDALQNNEGAVPGIAAYVLREQSRDAGGATSGGQGDAKKEACCYRPFWCKDVSGCLSMGCRRIGQTKAEREADLNAHSAGFICAEDMHADRSASQGAPTPPAHSADSDGGANKQDRQLVNQGRDEGMRAAFLAMQEAQTGGGEAVAPEARPMQTLSIDSDLALTQLLLNTILQIAADGGYERGDRLQRIISNIQSFRRQGTLHEHPQREGTPEYEAFMDAAAESELAAPPAPPAPLPGKRERALFQAWARDRHWNLSLRADGERYMSESTQEGWYAWKARAALSAQAAPEYRTGFDEAPSTFNQEDAAPADYPPTVSKEQALEGLNRDIKRLQMDIDDGSRPDQWSMQAIQENIRIGRRFIEQSGRSGVSADPLPRPLLTDLEIQGLRRQARNDPRCADQHWFILMVRAIESYYGVTGAAAQSQPLVEPPSRGHAYEAHQKNGLAWAVAMWNNTVKNRPLVNVHRRSFDDTWRQVIRYFGGDPDSLVGPSHDALLAASPQHQVKKGEPS